MVWIILAIAIMCFLIVWAIKESKPMRYNDFNDADEEEIITTTTVNNYDEEPRINICGTLKSSLDEANDNNVCQSYVIDPVDKAKIFVNPSDDLYEDAAGKIWRLSH